MKAPQLLVQGCYLIRFQPDPPDPDVCFYEGTIRVIRNQNEELRAAGDLYCRRKGKSYPAHYPSAFQRTKHTKEGDPVSAGGVVPDATEFDILQLPDPVPGIPVFDRADYRAYLKIMSVTENAPGKDQVTIRFEVHYFDERAQRWPQPGSRMMILSPSSTATTGKERINVRYEGDVMDDQTGKIVGIATVQFVSDTLRQAAVILCNVPGVAVPKAEEIESLFRGDLCWNLSVESLLTLNEAISESGKTSSLPLDGRAWTIAELHNLLQHAQRQRKAKDPKALLDEEWLYYLLCVPTIEGEVRGVMFDTYGGDSNNIPREAAAIAGHQVFPDEVMWGSVKDAKLQAAVHGKIDVYARVALHELGHAMGLDHNHLDNGIMNTTDVIAENAHLTIEESLAKTDRQAWTELLEAVTAAGGFNGKKLKQLKDNQDKAKKSAATKAFPQNVQLSFHPEDRMRLQLGPDIAIRPGTVYESGGPFFADADPVRAGDLELEVLPLLDTVPLGAPVRVGIRLRNIGGTRQRVPAYLSLSSGVVRGTVTDPLGESRTFWPLKRNMDSAEDKETDLEPGATSITESMTLLRGVQGALFPMAGNHRIVVEIAWARKGTSVFVEGEATVQVSPAVDDTHLALARGLLNAPDTLLNLALGLRIPQEETGKSGHVIRTACNNPILKPHYAVVLAKQEATPYFNVQTDKTAACDWIDASTVLSGAEIYRLATLLGESGLSSVRDILKAKVDKLLISGRIGTADAARLTEKLA
jgi:hypothetical protein